MHWGDDQKNSKRLELSISKNTLHGSGDKVPAVSTPGSRQVCLSRSEILEFVAFRDSGKLFQQFSRDFPRVFLENPRTDPGNSHSLLEFSEMRRKLSNSIVFLEMFHDHRIWKIAKSHCQIFG